MATDLDTPRTRSGDEEQVEESLEALRATRAARRLELAVDDEANLNEDLELPGADLSGEVFEDLVLRVVPQQADEFTCSCCFLVQHRSRLSREKNGKPICRDCD